MSAWLFLLKYDHEGAQLDDALDMSVADGQDLRSLFTAEKVAARMGHPFDQSVAEMARAVQIIGLRARLDGAVDGPYLVRTEGDLSRDQLLLLLRDRAMLQRIRAEAGVGNLLPAYRTR